MVFPGRSKIMVVVWAALLPLSLVADSVTAFAQQEIDARLNRLENEIQTLSRAVFRDEMPPQEQMSAMIGANQQTAAALAGNDVRLSQLEMEVAALTGKLEQQQFELRQMQERIEKLMDDFEGRLAGLEAARGGWGAPGSSALQQGQVKPTMQGFDTHLQVPVPQQVAPVSAPEGGGSALAPTDAVPVDAQAGGHLGTLRQSPSGELSAVGNAPADAYEQAYALLQDKNYEAAEKSFSDFLERYPDHDLAANAKYWLGETFYVRGDFERAARVFAEAYQRYPAGPKGPDNLLKLALSLNGMGKRDDACLTLAQLRREYRAGAAPVLARAEREWANMGCK